MTGKTIIDMAYTLSGLDMREDELYEQEELLRKSLFLVNQVLWDLNAATVSSLDTPIVLTSKEADAAVYGVARLLAAMSGYTSVQNELTELYNRKRAAARSHTAIRINRLPV